MVGTKQFTYFAEYKNTNITGIMTNLGIPQARENTEESSESLTTTDIYREVEFESDADHKEMTQTYGSDDYLSRWLPNIRRGDESGILRNEKMEKRSEKERQNRLFKSPCHHHEGRKSTPRDSKISQDPARKTYFEAIKCSPMKLRQSLAVFKQPKPDEKFSFQTNRDTALHHGKSLIIPTAAKHAAINLSISMDTEETLRRVQPTESKTPKPSTSLGIVEMHNDDTSQLGSLCFRKSFPENIYTNCSMVGGKLRKTHRDTDNVLITGRNKHKELLVRCESIMIYPKTLTRQKQHSEKYRSFRKHDKPKEAWKDCSQPIRPQNYSENSTKLPELATKDQTSQRDDNLKPLPELPLDNSKQELSIESHATQISTSTKIIIPFGENELNKSLGKVSKVLPTSQNVAVVTKEWGSTKKEEEVEAGKMKAKESNEHLGGRGIPMKTRCLKESSKLNEQTHSMPRHSGVILGVKQLEMDRKLPVSTQYLTVTTANSPLKRFRIPTGVPNTELVGRENYPPRKTVPYRFSYSQKGLPEYIKGFDGVSVKQDDSEDNDRYKQNVCLKIGGKGLLKAALVGEREVLEKSDDDQNRKRVQFLLQKSRYFT